MSTAIIIIITTRSADASFYNLATGSLIQSKYDTIFCVRSLRHSFAKEFSSFLVLYLFINLSEIHFTVYESTEIIHIFHRFFV